MPHANIWIRRKNWDKWGELENKAEFINNALMGLTENIKINKDGTLSPKDPTKPSSIKIVERKDK